MTCDDRRDAIFLYAAGELEPAEREGVRAHLTGGCPRCSGSLAEAEAVLASIPLALPPIQPSAATREKLMARVRSSPVAPPPPRTAPVAGAAAAPSRGGRFTLGSLVTYSGLAAAIAAIVTGVAVLQNTRVQTERQRAETAAVQAELARVRDTLSVVNAEKLQLVSLAVPEGKGAATGRVLWDVNGNRWHVIVFNLKPLPAGRAYQLWAIPAGGTPIPMDTFTVDANGQGRLAQVIPAGTPAIQVAAITDEPIGGSPQPTGTIQLAGEVK